MTPCAHCRVPRDQQDPKAKGASRDLWDLQGRLVSVDLKVCKAGLAVPDCRDSRVNEGHKENRGRVDHKVRHVIYPFIVELYFQL